MPFSLASVEQRDHAFLFFRRYCDTMLNDYSGEPEYINVCQAMINALTSNMDLPLTNPEHPFNLYAEPDSYDGNVERLRSFVYVSVRPGFERQLVQAFFHPNGSQRDVLDQLLNEYYDFVDESLEENGNDSPHTLPLSEHYEETPQSSQSSE
jgi:hypothetical protein